MKKVKAFLCVVCLVLCCGCWDKRELEDQTFVVMLGIDKTENSDVLVTIAFPLTQTEGGGNQGSAEGSGKYSVMSVKAPTLLEALNLFSLKLAGPLSLFSVKTVVISQELAESDMLPHVFSSWRYEQTRNNTNILISNGKAAEFLSARLENPLIDPLRQEDLLLEQSNYSAYYQAVQFLDFMINLKSGNADGVAMYGGVTAKDKEAENPIKMGYLPGEVPLKSDNASQICGLAVFRGNKMAGVLDSFETQTYSMLTRSKTKKILTLPDPLAPDSNIVVSILPNGKGGIRGYFVDGVPTFDIGVDLHCTIEAIQNETDYTSDQNYAILTESIRQACIQSMRELVSKIQKEYNADILKLGDKLAHNFLTVQEWNDYNWPEQYRDAEILIDVRLNIDRTGIFKP